MKLYTHKPNTKLNHQMAFDYAMLIIADNCFRNCHCDDTVQYDRLHARYAEYAATKQTLFEDMCLTHMDTHLLPKLPAEYWNAATTMRLVQGENNSQTRIIFTNEIGSLEITTKYRGKNSIICYRFKSKKETSFDMVA